MSSMMRAAVWTGPETITYRSVPKPKPKPGEALIRVSYGGICGTDLMIYLGKHPRAEAPLIMCHEFVGRIETANVGDSDAPSYAPGTPVAINPLLYCGHCYACRSGKAYICEELGLVGIDRDGGFAEYAAVPLHTVRPLPDSLPAAEAALIEPLAVGVHAVHVSDLKVGDATVVLGAGPVGIMTAQMARLAGASQIWISELSPRRISVARKLGFDVIDARDQDAVGVVRQGTDGVGVPVVFEAAGTAATVAQAGSMARIGGQILQVGMPKDAVTIDLSPLLFHEIRWRPIRVYREEDFDLAVEIAGSGDLDLAMPVTHILPLAELAKGLELAHEASDACKILVTPGL